MNMILQKITTENWMTEGIAPEGKVCLVHIFPLLSYAKPLQIPLNETLLVPPQRSFVSSRSRKVTSLRSSFVKDSFRQRRFSLKYRGQSEKQQGLWRQMVNTHLSVSWTVDTQSTVTQSLLNPPWLNLCSSVRWLYWLSVSSRMFISFKHQRLLVCYIQDSFPHGLSGFVSERRILCMPRDRFKPVRKKSYGLVKQV